MFNYPLFQPISGYAEMKPEHVAIRFSGQNLSCGDLEKRSNNLARILLDQGLQRGERVGICMNKGLESAVSMYGYMTEVERDLRDAVGGLLYSGTSDIQRNIISRLVGL